MPILLKDATYIDWESLVFTPSDILIEEGIEGGIRLIPPGEVIDLPIVYETLDCRGKLVTKSFAIGHHHVYSALARGMPAPKKKPENFREILQYIWWNLDKCLDEKTIRYSALVTAMAAAKAGSTFVIDHHASPGCIEGSLDIIADAFDTIGVGHLLCYEISDRDGKDKALKGLSETERYLSKRQGLVGLHASFTVGDATLERAVDIMKRFNTGVHVHVAEDKYDQEHCLKTYGKRVISRWYDGGLLDSGKTILVHGLHLDESERALFSSSPCWLAQNMESNQKNMVGFFNGLGLGERIMLGTDGMHSDMLQSARAAFFAGGMHDTIDFAGIYKRFRNVHNYIRENGFAGNADNNLVILDYDNPTALNKENFPGHFVFGFNSNHIQHVIANGKLIVKDKELQNVDQQEVLAVSRNLSLQLWNKLIS